MAIVTMAKKNKLSDFVMDKETGVYISQSNSRTFPYSDGTELENKILNIIKEVNNKSSDSMELELRIDDWATKYHFSNLRTNIIRSLDFLEKDSKILEIGAGCGGITRFLGENFKSVDSIEGSFKRAYITKERCKDLNNVRVFCSPLQDISFDQDYDIVMLIGIIEYAPLFYSQEYKKEDACLAMLKQATCALKNNGILVLAIENKLGLKYWSGCREDHTGKLFDSIHDYPGDNAPITFSKNELKQLLEKAQLKYYEFYYPFPDYKLTTTVLRKVSEPFLYYLHNWITVPFDDYSGRREFYFNEGLAIRSLVKAGLIYEFSNSFLIVASTTQGFVKKEKNHLWIAKRFSTNRILPFRTTAVLQHEHSQDLPVIHKYKLFDIEERGGFINLNISESKWIRGDLLWFSLCEALYKNNGLESLMEVFRKYHNELIRRYYVGEKDNEGYPIVCQNAVDFVPSNIISNEDGIFGIDHEWTFSKTVTADYILFRGIFFFVCQEYTFISRSISIPDDNIDRFTISIIRSFYPNYDMNRHMMNKNMEEEFQSIVSGGKSKLPSPEEVRITDDLLWQKEAIIKQKEDQIRQLQEFADKVKNTIFYKIYQKAFKPFKS